MVVSVVLIAIKVNLCPGRCETTAQIIQERQHALGLGTMLRIISILIKRVRRIVGSTRELLYLIPPKTAHLNKTPFSVHELLRFDLTTKLFFCHSFTISPKKATIF